MLLEERGADESARDYALRMLKKNIVAMTLKPGEMVSEKEIATQLGISRTPVREALQDLAKWQMVEILPQRGSRVSLIDYALVEESRFLRLVLEQAIVGLACEMATPQDLYALRECCQRQAFALAQTPPDSDAMMTLDDAFHALIFKAAHKEQTYEMLRGMTLHFDRVRSLALSVVKDSKILSDHQELIEAIAAHDASRAQEIVTRHLTRYQVDSEAIGNQYPEYMKKKRL